MTTKYACVALFACAALALSACGSKPPVISVGSRNSTEQLILGEIIAAHLEKQLPGVQIERKLGLGGPMAVQGAMQSGAIDVAVEDVGAMIGTVLNEDVPTDENVALQRARNQYQALFQVTVLKPLGFHHRFVVVGKRAGTLTAAGETGTSVRFGVAHDLAERKDAFFMLMGKYRLSLRELPKSMDAPAMYEALKAGKIDYAAGFSTDAWIGEAGFSVLKDDRNLFLDHMSCIVSRNQALAAVPALQKTLDGLAGKIGDEAIRKMNREADLKHRDPAVVAKEFLAGARL